MYVQSWQRSFFHFRFTISLLFLQGFSVCQCSRCISTFLQTPHGWAVRFAILRRYRVVPESMDKIKWISKVLNKVIMTYIHLRIVAYHTKYLFLVENVLNCFPWMFVCDEPLWAMLISFNFGHIFSYIPFITSNPYVYFRNFRPIWPISI